MHLSTFSTFLTLLASAAAAPSLIDLLKSQSDLSDLLKAVESIPGLAGELGKAKDVTILAPINSAFSAVSKNSTEGVAIASGNTADITSLLSYHVIDGVYTSSDVKSVPTFVHTLLTSSDTFDGAPATEVSPGQNVGLVLNGKKVQIISGELAIATVTEANIKAANGVIVHKIDAILQLPLSPVKTATNFGFTAITGALTATKLTTTVDDAKDVTVFVPTNGAFEAIGNILANASVATLEKVLGYHVISGSVVFSSDIKDEKVKSLAGPDLDLNVVDGAIFVNSAQVIIPNVIISNGVAHVINEVLNPAVTSVDVSKLKPGAKPTPDFSSASSASVGFVSDAPAASTTLTVPKIATSAPAVAAKVGTTNKYATTGGAASASSSTSGNAAPIQTAGAIIGLGVGVLAALAL